jgi:hypothetical protein
VVVRAKRNVTHPRLIAWAGYLLMAAASVVVAWALATRLTRANPAQLAILTLHLSRLARKAHTGFEPVPPP